MFALGRSLLGLYLGYARGFCHFAIGMVDFVDVAAVEEGSDGIVSVRKSNWVFTLNHYTQAEVDFFDRLPCRYIIYGFEVCPTTQTQHLQGFVRFNNVRNLGGVKRLNGRCHWEIARTVSAAIDYCKKEGNFVERGTRPLERAAVCESARAAKMKKNRELADGDLVKMVDEGEICFSQLPVMKKAKMIYQSHGQPYAHPTCRGEWWYGVPGCGKSEAAFAIPDMYQKNQNVWWDGYSRQEVVVIDDVDQGWMGHNLKRWADKYPVTGETKFGHANLCHKRLIVTSNFLPKHLFKDSPMMLKAIEERFIFKEFKYDPNHPSRRSLRESEAQNPDYNPDEQPTVAQCIVADPPSVVPPGFFNVPRALRPRPGAIPVRLRQGMHVTADNE